MSKQTWETPTIINLNNKIKTGNRFLAPGAESSGLVIAHPGYGGMFGMNHFITTSTIFYTANGTSCRSIMIPANSYLYEPPANAGTAFTATGMYTMPQGNFVEANFAISCP